MNTRMPTGRDIRLEVDGKTLAAVQQYRVKANRGVKLIRAIGSKAPLGMAMGEPMYELELTKVVLSKEMDPMDLYALEDFSVMIVKPDCRIVYSGCQWVELEEVLDLGEPCIAQMKLRARSRTCLEVNA